MTEDFNLEESFEEVYKKYFNPLCNFAYQYVKDWEDSREIVQDTMAKIWINRKNLKIHSSVQSYLYQATKNGVIDFVRKSSKLVDNEDNIRKTMEDNLKSEENLKPYKVRQAILEAMESLKPKNREIFKLNKIEGLTYKEIANHLNISERSVEDNISRAFKILKEQLDKNEDLF